MKVQYSPDFYRQYKKADVRVRNSVDEKIEIFSIDPSDLQLNNHILTKKWEGHRSIDITSDWRAIYQEIREDDEPFAYFVALGTHNELYRPTPA